MGAFYGRRHRDAEAFADFRTGAQLDPRSGQYAYAEALLLGERGEHVRAMERLDEAIRIEPNVRKYYSSCGSAQIFAGMYAEARADYDKALQTPDKHAPPREIVLANLGRGYAALLLRLVSAGGRRFRRGDQGRTQRKQRTGLARCRP